MIINRKTYIFLLLIVMYVSIMSCAQANSLFHKESVKCMELPDMASKTKSKKI